MPEAFWILYTMVTVTSYRSLKTTIIYCRSLMSLLSHMSLYSANFPMCLVQVLGNELNRKKAILYLPPLKQQVARELQYKADYLHGLKTVGSQKNNAVNHVKKVQHLPMLISLYLLKKKWKCMSQFSVYLVALNVHSPVRQAPYRHVSVAYWSYWPALTNL